MPRRPRNADVRPREYLTSAKAERLIEHAGHSLDNAKRERFVSVAC